jgi:nicotinamidase/pyrazinamidase
VQRDFLPGGALPVPRGDEVVPALNRYLEVFTSRGLAVLASRDWHPPDHCSFYEQGGIWPPHCVASSRGAELAPALKLPDSTSIVSKATESMTEAYSDFEGTDLETRLRGAGISRLFVGGLATEYCVLATVRDALTRGFSVVLLVDAIRAINVRPGDGRRAETEMFELGAVPLRFEQLSSPRRRS